MVKAMRLYITIQVHDPRDLIMLMHEGSSMQHERGFWVWYDIERCGLRLGRVNAKDNTFKYDKICKYGQVQASLDSRKGKMNSRTCGHDAGC
jgi:hypothetical protein